MFPISDKQTHSSSLISVGELHTNFSSFPAHDQGVSDTLFLWYT